MSFAADKRRLLLAGLVVLDAGWMLLDGVTGVMTGDYIGGELGPWAALVGALGIDPLAMRIPFVLLGLAGISIATLVLRRAGRSELAALAWAILTVWYAVVGTILSLAIVGVALWVRRRGV